MPLIVFITQYDNPPDTINKHQTDQTAKNVEVFKYKIITSIDRLLINRRALVPKASLHAKLYIFLADTLLVAVSRRICCNNLRWTRACDSAIKYFVRSHPFRLRPITKKKTTHFLCHDDEFSLMSWSNRTQDEWLIIDHLVISLRHLPHRRQQSSARQQQRESPQCGIYKSK